MFLTFLPHRIYNQLIDQIFYVLMLIEAVTKLKYYTWLSISRTGRKDLNKIDQLIFSLTSLIITPILMYIFVYKLNLNMIGILLSSSITGTIQRILTELYFRFHHIELT